VIVTLAAVTVGLAIAVIAVTVGLLALLVRILGALDAGTALQDSTGSDPGPDDGGGGDDRSGPPSDRGGEPAWWPEFERELARYVRDRTARAGPVTIEGP
jgi:hypothetical protein